VLGAWERRPELVRRVHRILAGPGNSMGRRPSLAAMGSVTAGALACTLALAHAPQLVRFASPVHISGQTQAMAPLDAQELGRELGGKPQMVKAMMDAPAHCSRPARQTAGPGATVRTATARRPKYRTPPPTRLANLRTTPPRTPDTMLVMTAAWTDTSSRTQVIVTFAQAERQTRLTEVRTNQPRPAYPPPGYAPLGYVTAGYALVPTPAGWLVIQI
jgi:hypothetical protein